jgi:hypothetical protein
MKKEICLILFLLIILVSCKKNDPEPKPTPTIIYQDCLTVDDKTWASDSNTYYIRKFNQGHYFIRVDTIGFIAYSLAPYGYIISPYSVQVDATIQLDNSNMIGNIGIIFNHLDYKDFAVAEICSNGAYDIWQVSGGTFSSIMNPILSYAINKGSGAKNTIKIIQNETSLELQINNVSIGTFPVYLPDAYVGVGMSTSTVFNNFYTPATGLFNNLIISKN